MRRDAIDLTKCCIGRIRSSVALCGALAILCVAGCGQPRYYNCAGQVTRDGRPIPYLEIKFMPDDPAGRTPNTSSDENGNFVMRVGRDIGVEPGTYKICVVDPLFEAGGQTPAESDEWYEDYMYVIDRYSPAKSDIKYSADQHITDFQLKLDTSEYAGDATNDAPASIND